MLLAEESDQQLEKWPKIHLRPMTLGIPPWPASMAIPALSLSIQASSPWGASGPECQVMGRLPKPS